MCYGEICVQELLPVTFCLLVTVCYVIRYTRMLLYFGLDPSSIKDEQVCVGMCACMSILYVRTYLCVCV